MSALHKIERLPDPGNTLVEWMRVPGGWLYIATAGFADTASCAATFVPEPPLLNRAAPELFDALSELLDYQGGAEHGLDDPYVVERARAAIAKATGEAP